MRSFILLFLFYAVSIAQHSDPAKELANAERAFSAASENYGVKQSFLQFLSDECVMFNPGPVNGMELYRKRSENSVCLTWYPTYVEVSASGDFGISTGPWEYRRTKNDTNVAYGHYFSVWKKQSNGGWKVVLDNGISYPDSLKRTEQTIVRDLKKSKKPTIASSAETILELERAFSNSIRENGGEKTYKQYCSDDMKVYRRGSFPTRTRDAAQSLFLKQEKKISFVANAQLSSAGDIGYSYGYSVNEKNDSSAFVRVWRKEKDWKIAVDIQEEYPR